MLPTLVMDLLQWRLTEWRRVKARTSTKAKAVALLAMNGWMHGCMDVGEAEDAPTKVKERVIQKARTKVRRAIKREKCKRKEKQWPWKCCLWAVFQLL
jgi:hypothetical protein